MTPEELLKEVGEPVAHVQVTPDGNLMLTEITKTAEAQQIDQWDRQMGWTLAPLYTSDQLAAAVARATKPLIEERDRAVKRMEAGWIEVCDSGILAFKEMNDELEQQLAAAQEEIERLKATPPDKREDLRCVISDLCHQVRERDAQLAKVEQRVVEAFIECMVVLKQRDYAFTGTTVIGIEKCETAIRSGEWRKFVKEV